MRKSSAILFGLVLLTALSFARPIPPAPAAQDVLLSRIDAILSPAYKAGEPGAALLIQKDGQALARKAYGTADLELGIALEPDMVFRIGSMTKQFTAVSILMLMEQGKLALNDPLTKFLPDYPLQGRTVTVEHEWLPLWRNDMTVAEIIALFKDKPFDFEPGEKWAYNNSGYILLGAIIEKVSGLTYEAFLQKNLFDPLGLKHTYYGSSTRIIPRRIPGYGPGPNGTFLNAEYLSMTQPYAAGSLLSNVDDLAAWNDALLAGKLIKRETLEKAWTPYKLKDGSSSGYGYGWSIGDYEGHRMIRHGGGINGFSTDGILFPEDKLFVTLLTNSAIPARAPEPYGMKIAAIALGKPMPETRTAITVDPKIFDPYVGEYELAPGFSIKFFRQGAKFMTQASGQAAFEIFPESETKFFLKVVDGQVEFVKDAAGKVTGMVLTQNGRKMPGQRLAK
ncbi:MAG: serine hydrolase [Candidatus Aminicenantes bacterium]|nr:serine hydrolase [Candidatus Aminicenantes bacterium]